MNKNEYLFYVHQCLGDTSKEGKFIILEGFALGAFKFKLYITTINLIYYVTNVLININDV